MSSDLEHQSQLLSLAGLNFDSSMTGLRIDTSNI